MMQTYTVEASMYTETEVNAIHEDKLAQRVGFAGGPLPGVLIFGYLTQLPVRASGLEWLTHNRAEVRFLKPAYEGQRLECTYTETAQGSETTCINPQRVQLAVLHSQAARSGPDPRSRLAPGVATPSRAPLNWETLTLDQPVSAHTWLADEDNNRRYAWELGDTLDLYRGPDACVHPFWIMREGNAAFKNAYVLPPTIHVGSELTFHTPLRVGEQIQTRLVPMAKWERKGHKFVTLYISCHVRDVVCVEMAHTFIINIADA